MLDGKSMIHRVWERVREVIDDVVVATDDSRIVREVEQFGGHVMMTQSNHLSGTDRCAETAERYNKDASDPAGIILNIQGDEPFLQPGQLSELVGLFELPGTDIATLIRKCSDPDDISDPNQPKVVVDKMFRALYFSRFSIPYIRNQDQINWHNAGIHYKHIGMYGFRADVLEHISKLQKTTLEISESLEQLRWLEHGYAIQTHVSQYESISIDTLQDLQQAQKKGHIHTFSLPD